MILSGDLRGFPAADLLQWAVNERADGIFAVDAGEGFRLRFAHGALVAATCGDPARSLSQFLVAHGLLGRERAIEVARRAAARNVVFAHALAECGDVADLRGALEAAISAVAFAFVRLPEGPFAFDRAAEPMPESLRAEVSATKVVLEGLWRGRGRCRTAAT